VIFTESADPKAAHTQMASSISESLNVDIPEILPEPLIVFADNAANIGQAFADSYFHHEIETENIKTDDIIISEALAVPYLTSDFKAYMAYDMVTDRTAPQWHYRETAYTDENGLRRIGDDYLVAMGTYYSEAVGARFRITLDSGNVFTVTVGDIKNPLHTDKYNMYTPIRNKSGAIISANVLEFIVDMDKLDKMAAKLGTVSCIDGLNGDVEKIERLAENSNSANKANT
jgi:hypothetical protein